MDPELSSKAKVIGSKFVRIVSPVSQAELLNMSNKEIAKYLREYVESKHESITTVYSLGQAIRELSRENPAKMVEGLKQFINTDYYYSSNNTWLV